MITIKEVQKLWKEERPEELPLSLPILQTISKEVNNAFVCWVLVSTIDVLNSNEDCVTELGMTKKELGLIK